MWHDFIEARELLLVVSLELESRDAGAADGAELCIAQRGAHVSGHRHRHRHRRHETSEHIREGSVESGTVRRPRLVAIIACCGRGGRGARRRMGGSEAKRLMLLCLRSRCGLVGGGCATVRARDAMRYVHATCDS